MSRWKFGGNIFKTDFDDWLAGAGDGVSGLVPAVEAQPPNGRLDPAYEGGAVGTDQQERQANTHHLCNAARVIAVNAALLAGQRLHMHRSGLPAWLRP